MAEQKLNKIQSLRDENKILVFLEFVVFGAQIGLSLITDIVPFPYAFAFPIFIVSCVIKVWFNIWQIGKFRDLVK